MTESNRQIPRPPAPRSTSTSSYKKVSGEVAVPYGSSPDVPSSIDNAWSYADSSVSDHQIPLAATAISDHGALAAGPGSIPPPNPEPDPYIGTTIDGRYKIEGLLGEGGMGVVYRARHKVIGKPVAMKVLRADMARDAEITERFLREARSASAIGNPHIIDISDFGTLPDGATYFVMEFLDGRSLSDVVEKDGPMPLARLVHLAKQVANGLGDAHAQEIVHRDLKPDNVFVIDRGTDKDFVKILDFGIAKVSTGTSKLTRHGSVFGTPHYMSPEQAAGAPVDHRTDIYSLGVMMYEMAAGRVPFDAENFMGILTQHMYQAPVPIRALVPTHDVAPGLEAIILKCLSKKPEQRYQSMAELIEDMDRLDKGISPGAVGEMMARSGGFNVPADFFKSAMPAPIPATPAQRRKPWPLIAGLASVGVAVVLVVGVLVVDKLTAAAPAPTTVPLVGVAPEPSVPVAASPSSSAPQPEAMHEVMVVTVPMDATIKLGDKDHVAPLQVPIPKGQTVKVLVTANGYQDREVELTEGDTRKEIVLRPNRGGGTGPANPTPTATTPTTPTTPTKPPTTKPTGEVVNPWG